MTVFKLSISMQVPVRQIMEGLGGDRFVKRPIRHEFDLIELVKEGLPMESVAFLQANFGFTNKEMSHILAISESTYQRRIRAKEKMTQDETEKAISLSEVYEKGMEVFEDQEGLRLLVELNHSGTARRKANQFIKIDDWTKAGYECIECAATRVIFIILLLPRTRKAVVFSPAQNEGIALTHETVPNYAE